MKSLILSILATSLWYISYAQILFDNGKVKLISSSSIVNSTYCEKEQWHLMKIGISINNNSPFPIRIDKIDCKFNLMATSTFKHAGGTFHPCKTGESLPGNYFIVAGHLSKNVIKPYSTNSELTMYGWVWRTDLKFEWYFDYTPLNSNNNNISPDLPKEKETTVQKSIPQSIRTRYSIESGQLVIDNGDTKEYILIATMTLSEINYYESISHLKLIPTANQNPVANTTNSSISKSQHQNQSANNDIQQSPNQQNSVANSYKVNEALKTKSEQENIIHQFEHQKEINTRYDKTTSEGIDKTIRSAFDLFTQISENRKFKKRIVELSASTDIARIESFFLALMEEANDLKRDNPYYTSEPCNCNNGSREYGQCHRCGGTAVYFSFSKSLPTLNSQVASTFIDKLNHLFKDVSPFQSMGIRDRVSVSEKQPCLATPEKLYYETNSSIVDGTMLVSKAPYAFSYDCGIRILTNTTYYFKYPNCKYYKRFSGNNLQSDILMQVILSYSLIQFSSIKEFKYQKSTIRQLENQDFNIKPCVQIITFDGTIYEYPVEHPELEAERIIADLNNEVTEIKNICRSEDEQELAISRQPLTTLNNIINVSENDISIFGKEFKSTIVSAKEIKTWLGEPELNLKSPNGSEIWIYDNTGIIVETQPPIPDAYLIKEITIITDKNKNPKSNPLNIFTGRFQIKNKFITSNMNLQEIKSIPTEENGEWICQEEKCETLLGDYKIQIQSEGQSILFIKIVF